MKMKTKNIAVAIAAFTAAAGLAIAPAHAQAFSDGNFGGSGTATYGGVWTTTPLTVGAVAGLSHNESLDGLNDYSNVHFNGGNSPAGTQLSQTFATIAGDTYTVGYTFGDYDPSGSGLTSQVINSLINGTAEQTETETATRVGAPTVISQGTFSYTFVASSTSTTLAFNDVGSTGTTGSDGILENVSVVPTPEAATWIGGAFAVLALLGLTLRSRKSNTSLDLA